MPRRIEVCMAWNVGMSGGTRATVPRRIEIRVAWNVGMSGGTLRPPCPGGLKFAWPGTLACPGGPAFT